MKIGLPESAVIVLIRVGGISCNRTDRGLWGLVWCRLYRLAETRKLEG
jgi:hypothetical protein